MTTHDDLTDDEFDRAMERRYRERELRRVARRDENVAVLRVLGCLIVTCVSAALVLIVLCGGL